MGSGSNTTVSATVITTANDPAIAAAAKAAAAVGNSYSSNHSNSYRNPHNSTRSDGSVDIHHHGSNEYVQDPAEFLSRIAEAESEKSKARRTQPSWDS